MEQRDLVSAVIKTIILIILTCISAAFLHYYAIGMIESKLVGNVAAIVTALLIILTDIYLLLKNNQIVDRKAGIVFLGVASIAVISFQVICDFLNLNLTDDWHILLFDAMFNVSFCMLFIITFNFADVYTLKLTNKMSE